MSLTRKELKQELKSVFYCISYLILLGLMLMQSAKGI